MQSPLLAQPPIEHSQAQLEDLADRLIVGARLRPDDWPILVVAVERMIADFANVSPSGLQILSAGSKSQIIGANEQPVS